jgi:hypothetical protein
MTTETTIPVYGVICRTGKEWTIKYREHVEKNGTTINGSKCGYGTFPFAEYYDLPVIDLTGESFDRCFEALKIHDSIRPHMFPETLPAFLEAHRQLGFKVVV